MPGTESRGQLLDDAVLRTLAANAPAGSVRESKVLPADDELDPGTAALFNGTLEQDVSLSDYADAQVGTSLHVPVQALGRSGPLEDVTIATGAVHPQ